MSKLVVLNARIPVGLKKAMNRYCDEKGLKVQAFIENLIQERLEDELDQRIIEKRLTESTVPLAQVIKELGLDRKK
ncbi:MAG: hypothetical protein KDD52_05745 [Bdellovibrionales bacterium]|nr:hypothetical protein [Bdellovibrionales bacterium]